MANENFKTLETIDGIEYVFNYKKFRDELRRMSRLMKQKGSVSSVEEYREAFAEKIMVSVSALKQWESGRNGVSDLERVKEIAMHLYLPDYRKLLMPKSEPVEKESSVMMNRVIDERERDAAREIFVKMVEYINIFDETSGFSDFSFNTRGFTSSMEFCFYDTEFRIDIDKMRFDLPKSTYDKIVELYDEIGSVCENEYLEVWSIYETKEYKKYIEENYTADLSNNPHARAAFMSRKNDEYYEKLCDIMKDYLK